MEVEGFQQSLRVTLFTCVTVTVMTYLACEMWSMKDRRADPQTQEGTIIWNCFFIILFLLNLLEGLLILLYSVPFRKFID